MKKTLFSILLLCVLLCASLLFVACDEGTNTDGKSAVDPPSSADVGLTSKALTLNGTTLSATFSNETTLFSFFNDITIADDASYIVATDVGCSNVIQSKTVTLEEGDNTFYILVTCGKDMQLYTVSLYRRPICTVSFATAGGTLIDSQQIEKGECATRPEIDPSRTGYTFDRWDYDFSQPISGETTINAVYTPITYTATFKVDGETIDTVDFTVETESITPPTIPSKAGYNGTWESYTLGAENITVNAVYTPITYTATFKADGHLVDMLTFTVETENIKPPAIPSKKAITARGKPIRSVQKASRSMPFIRLLPTPLPSRRTASQSERLTLR